MSDLSAVLNRIGQIQQLITEGPSIPGVPAGGADFATVLAGTSSATSGTATSTSVTSASDQPAPSTSGGASGGITGAAVVTDAKRYLGIPYVWGGTGPDGYDCSGLVQKVYSDLGISLPRTSEEQALVGSPVPSLADAQPGDLVFFAGSDGTASSPGHVGIYMGDGMMIDAPYTGTVVREEPVSDAGPVVAIRRIVGSVPATAAPSTPTPAPSGTSGSGAAAAYAADFASAGARYGVPATLLSSVARVESGYDPGAVSSAGAEGLMQLMPSTAASLGVDPWSPTQAIDGAARLLSEDYHQFGSWPLAVAAYNAGAGAVAEYGGIPPYPQTEAYVTNVLSGAGMAT